MSKSLLPKIAIVGILAAGAGVGWYLYTSGPVPTLAAKAPADTALWVEIPKFKQTLGAFRKSAAYEDFKKSQLFDEFNKGWGELIKELKEDEQWKKTKLEANEDTLMNFLGQNAAYGVIAPKTGKPSVYFMSKIDVFGLIKEGIESGQWAELVTRLQGAAKGKDGKVETYEGVEIITRTRKDKYSKKEWSLSLSMVGSAIVVSDNIETVKKVIDVDKGKKPSLAVEPGFAEEFKKLPSDKVAMAWMDTGVIRDKERFKNVMLQSVEMLGGERELKQFKKLFTGNELDILVSDLKEFRGIAGALHMPEGDLYSMQFASSRQGPDTFQVFDKRTNISDRVTDDTLFFFEMKDVYKTIEGFIQSDTFKKMRETKLGQEIISFTENPSKFASMTGEELPREFRKTGRFEMKMGLALLSVAAREVLSNDVSMTLDVVEAKTIEDALRPIIYVRTRPALRIIADVAAGIFAEHSKESGVKNYDHNTTKVFQFKEGPIELFISRVNGDLLLTTDKATIEGLIDGKAGPGASKALSAALAKTPKDAQFTMYFNSKVYSKLFNTLIGNMSPNDRAEVETILKLSSSLPEYAAIAAKVSPDYKDYEVYTYQKLPDTLAKEIASSFPISDPHPDVWNHLPKESFAALHLEMQPLNALQSLIKLLMPIIVPNILEARKHGNEAAAVGSLRTIIASQAIFRERNDSQKYGTLKQLGDEEYIGKVLASGTKQGYRIVVQPVPGNEEYQYWAAASPISPASGDRHFYTDHSGTIRFAYTPLTLKNAKRGRVLGRGGPRLNPPSTISEKLNEKEIQRVIDEGIAEFNKEALLGYRLKEDILANLGKSHGFSIINQEKFIPNGVSIADQEKMIAVPAGVLCLQVTQTKIFEEMLQTFNDSLVNEMGDLSVKYTVEEDAAIRLINSINSAQHKYRRLSKTKLFGTMQDLVKMKLIGIDIPQGQFRGYKFELRLDPSAPQSRYMIKSTPIDGYGFHFASDQSGSVRMVQEGFDWKQNTFIRAPHIRDRLPSRFVVKRRGPKRKVEPLGFVKTGDYYRLIFPKRDEREINQSVGNGFRPCYTFHEGYLIVTTSEGAMKRALAAKKGESLAESASLARLMKGQPRSVNSSFFVSFDGVMKQIKANSKMIAREVYPVPSEVTSEGRNGPQANKAAAIGALRTLNSCQAIFLERDQAQQYGTLSQLVAAGYIDEKLGSGEKNGYKFIVQPGPKPQYQYWIAADPITKGGKHLFTNQNGVVFESDKPIRPMNKTTSSPPRSVSPVGRSNYWEIREAKRKKEREWRKENLDANNKALKEILDSAGFLGGLVSTSTLKGNEAESRLLYRLKMD